MNVYDSIRRIYVDYFDLPDAPLCRVCVSIISEYPDIEGGKARCLDGTVDVCFDCCDNDICSSARDEAAREGAEP
jgi:hypothetical protein